MKKWLKNNTWRGLQLWGNSSNPPICEDGLKMRFVCDRCNKSKEFTWPDLPTNYVQSERGDVWCKKCYKSIPLIDPHRTGAAIGYK